ncbi:type I polyketide synthase [Streptomyces albireticuli]|uniref:type I polyketide synthase n=1 Tax=Streptomyces albireticuli TaxID=1940 RepID=UPI001E3870B8|nr:type I polyketide synthase [Streptomyces albireticuli]
MVGIGLRLPGGIRTLDSLWAALVDGRDLVGEITSDRFSADAFVADGPARAGKSYTAAAALLDDVVSFDADYFGISPKEAARIDPQHRLLLESAVEAFDDAGINPGALAGSDAAVMMGLSSHDYGDLQQRRIRTSNPYVMSGSAACNAANRLSYFFDLRGPSQAVDTACSSALTAVHHACEALRSGRSRLALAGGANVLLSPLNFVGFSHASMLSRTGRCRPFSAAADGFVRAEGAGVLVLKPLSAALEDGDRIHGVIAASAVNADGRTAGLALPSTAAQAELMEQVYAQAGVTPEDVAYVEAHGTGTQAGDPVECEALGQVLGRRRENGALPIGSVKANIGHLEAASGIAGLLKGLLVLREKTIPATLHMESLNPAIDFDGLGLEPVGRQRPLPVGGGLVGVNSFGFGGANAHAVLAPAPGDRSARRAQVACDESALGPNGGGRLPVVVSARTPKALTEAAQAWADAFESQVGGGMQEHFYDAAFTACRRRARHDHQIAVLADGPEAAASALRAVAAGESAPGAFSGSAVKRGRIAFVFSGNASQWAGMGSELLREDSAFADEVAAVDTVLTPLLGWSVLEELASPSDPGRWDHTEVAQPVLFALQAGLMAALVARGVEPSAVTGHSVGEVAAAYCAGALDLGQACQVVAARSRAQASTAGMGRMVAVGLSPDAARTRLAAAAFEGRLVIAGVNSDRDVTVAGDAEALGRLGAELGAEGIFFRDLGLNYAFHSPAMDALREPLKRALSALTPAKSRIPMVSTVTGAVIDGRDLDHTYWWRNVREPVRFSDAVAGLTEGENGCDVLVEIGPHPVLGAYLRRATAGGGPIAVVPTLSRTGAGTAALDAAQAHLLAVCAQVRWNVHFPRQGRVRDLPGYPWQRERHWSGGPDWWLEDNHDQEPAAGRHPLLGARQPVAAPTWRQQFDADTTAWLADHTVAGAVVFPAAAYVDMALSAGRAVLEAPAEVMNLSIGRALTLSFDSPDAHVAVATTLTAEGVFTVASRGSDGSDWNEHARSRVRRLLREQPAPLDLDDIRSRLTSRFTAEDHYAACADAGLPYGPAFRTLASLETGEGEVLATYRTTMKGTPGHQAHPTVLDGALQAGVPLLATAAAAPQPMPFLPAGIDTVRCWQPMPESGRIHVRARLVTDRDAVWDTTVTTSDGHVVLELLGCRMRRFDIDARLGPQRLTEVLRATPLVGETSGSSPLPSPQVVRTACAEELARLTTAWLASPYAQAAERVLEIVGHFTAAAVVELLPGRGSFSVDDLLTAGVEVKYTRLLRILLATAVKTGLLQTEEQGRWRLAREPAPQQVFAAALRHVSCEVTGALIYGVCGQNLASVLQGRTDPLELLFSETDALAMRFYDALHALQHLGSLAERLLTSALASWPQDRPLRILEVGGGTGGLTGLLLRHLPPHLTRYTFTDVSSAFFRQAQQRFSDYDFVDYQVLDLNKDISEQGFTPASFDLVIAANVLHATEDLSASLRRTADLLTDGGHLLALESHRHDVMAPVFGLLDSFWTATDTTLRPDGPLLPQDQWPELLHACGFTGTVQTCEGETPEGMSVIHTARQPRSLNKMKRPVPNQGGAGDPTVRRWMVGLLSAAGREPVPAHEVAKALDLVSAGTVRTVDPHVGPAQWSRWLSAPSAPTDIVLMAGSASRARAQDETEEAVAHLAVLKDLSTANEQIAASADSVDDRAPLNVWVVTPGAPGALCPPPASGAAAAMWGAARTLANEQPGLAVRRIALAPAQPPHEEASLLERLVAEMLSCPPEDEVLLTSSGRFTTVVRPVPQPTRPSAGSSFTLTVKDPGLRYRLGWQPRQTPVPLQGQAVIEVAAAALNYRDIMIVTGMIPPTYRHDEVADVGLEFAGVVSAVGPGVTRFRVGDRVAGMAQGCFGSHVITRADRLLPVPPEMPLEAAVTLPAAFLTVQYSLGQVARLTAGETLLVHGAAGGVGLAALQYARRAGAEVIATAGTPAKRDLLRLLGVQHVLDSRSLHFAEQIRDLTGGQGVDVVLNSLAGEPLVRSLGLLKPFGRFVELGKRDFLADTSLPLGAFINNLSFHGVDVMALAEASPVAEAQFAELTAAVTKGDFRPLPSRAYPARRIDEAFACLQHSRHVGKVVITFDEDVPVQLPPEQVVLDPRATYLITGGLGGFGAETARHLAARGARHLTLVSRRGTTSPEAPALLEDLHALGTEVATYAADAADEAVLRRILDDIDNSGRRLAGVLHAAMVLDDAPLTQLTDERVRAVLTPKMTAGHLLDDLTREHELDFFILYSSMATLAGNWRQAPYVAANQALEALARDRRRRGAAALAIQWSVISDAGYVHRSERLEELASYGLGSLTAHEALAELDLITHSTHPVIAAGTLNWSHLRRFLPILDAPRTAHLMPERSDTQAADVLHTALTRASTERALALIEDTLAQLLADVLQSTPERIDRTRRLDLLGMDSLMAAELAVLVHQRIGIDLPVVELAQAGNLKTLAQRIHTRLAPADR